MIFFVASLTCIIIAKSISSNQTVLETMPFYVLLPLAIIYAPVVEEALFRGCIRRFIANDILFIIISGIVFGLLHTFFSEFLIFNILVLAIPYALMGAFLAYIYTKTNNIFSNIFCHAFNNLIATIISMLIIGLFVL